MAGSKSARTAVARLRPDVDVIILLTHDGKTAPMQTDDEADPNVWRDIDADPGERNDVAGKNPVVFEAMRTEMVRLLAEVQADARLDWRESWLRRW